MRFLAGLCRPTRMACAATILATAAEHLDTSGQLQRRKTKAKPSWAEMDLVLCSWETGEIFLSLDRSRRFRSADCREKSRCVTAEDLVPPEDGEWWTRLEDGRMDPDVHDRRKMLAEQISFN